MYRTPWITASLLIAAIVVAPLRPALSAKGSVVAHPSGCDYFIVETATGYALLEWFGGNDPSVGDVIVGPYEGYGMQHVYNVTRNSETQVWVEDYMLSQESAVEKYHDHCN